MIPVFFLLFVVVYDIILSLTTTKGVAMPKLGSAGTIHVSIVKRKRKDGSLYVQEVKSQYDPKTKNSRVISSKTLGILP